MIKIVQEKEAKFITHAGSFHADEVMATALLEILYDEILLARVGEVEEAKEDAFIYDVGLGNYDHHQEDKARRENGIAYSSVGLIWRDYGKEVLKKMGIEDNLEDYFLDIDEQLIMPIDALDNGEGERAPMTITSVISLNNPFWNAQKTSDEAFLESVSFAHTVFCGYVDYLTTVYQDQELDWDKGYEWLDQVLKKLVLNVANKANCFIYNEEGNALDMWDEYGEDVLTYYRCPVEHAHQGVHNVRKMFIDPLSYERPEYEGITSYPIEQIAIILGEHQGEAMLEKIFDRCIESEASRLCGNDYVEQCIDLAQDHIVVLKKFAPWKGTLLKSESPKANDVYLVVFPSQRGGWNYQGIPLSPASFDTRITVPEEWCGKRDQELAELTGIKEARFIHPNGFIGGTDSFEATIALAKAIIAYTESQKK